MWSIIDGKKTNRRAVIWVSWNIDTHELKWCTIARSYYEAVNSMGLGEMPVGYAASRLYDAPDKIIQHFNQNRRFIMK